MKKISLFVSLLLIGGLEAVEIPNIGDVLNEVKPPKIQKKKKILPPLVQESEEYKRTLEDGKKVEVKKFLITGAIHLSNKELKEIVRPYEQKMLSFKDMQDITELITKAYKDKGYFVARAYIPVQNLQKQNRLLKIAVIEGEYGKFILENNSLVKDSVLQAKLDEEKKNSIVSKKGLERALLLINDTPGVTISETKIKAGEVVGTSDFIISTKGSQAYNGYIIADNYGSPYTGEYRVMAGLDINSPFEIGDSISLSALSSDNRGLLNGRAAYGFPLHSNGLRAEVSYTKTTYELGDSYAQLDAIGYADSIVAEISFPYIRSTNENLDIYFKTAYNKMNDEIQAVDTVLEKNTLVATLGIDYEENRSWSDRYVNLKFSPSLTFGRLSFKRDEDKQNDQNGANTSGQFAKVNLNLEGNIFFEENLQWKNRLQLQYALGNKNLNGSEDMSIGGTNGVKYYPSGEESAENGYLFSTELIYPLPIFYDISTQVGLFYDVGRVFMSRNTLGEESRTLQDVGVSLSGSYKKFFINSHLAYKVGGADVITEESYGSKFMFQVGMVF